jgi:hypothetical protein
LSGSNYPVVEDDLIKDELDRILEREQKLEEKLEALQGQLDEKHTKSWWD